GGPPVVEGFPAEVVGGGRRVVGQRVAPVAAPVDRVGIGLQQLIDRPGPLVGGGIGGEAEQRLGLGQLAGQVERGAAQEGLIVGSRRQPGAGRQCAQQRR